MSTVWTLLITDDCAEDREVFREYLSSDPHQSYQILEAASAEVGLELCQKKRCDAILLDFCLPDMTGLEFLDELKQQGLEAPFPVIMLTGQGNEQVAVQAIKRGAQDYLVKQYLEPDDLQMAVRNVIHQSHLQHQLSKPQERQHLTAEVAFRIRQSLELEHILQTVVAELQQLLECDRVVIYQMAANPSRLQKPDVTPYLTQRCEAGLSNTIDPIQQFTSFLADPNQPSFEEVEGIERLEKGKASVIVSRSHRKAPASYLLVPIPLVDLGNSTQLWGLLVACRGSEGQPWQTDEVTMLSELVGQLAIAIHQAEQFAQAHTALEHEKQLNAFKSQFVATVSHAYRTPLATILAAASTLKLHRDRVSELKQQQFLQLIEDKVRHMGQLVDDLLVIEQLELGKAAFTPLPFELLQFFSDIIEEQRAAIVSSSSPFEVADPTHALSTEMLPERTTADVLVHHELTFKITGNTRNFWGDQKLLRQILINLLSNAIRYSPDGGNIEVHLMGNDSHITFDVRDEGIGIPSQDQNQLFQAFSRGSNSGNIPGAGLGLAIVKACVELHGGEITVSSQEGRGTTVTVCLPKQPS